MGRPMRKTIFSAAAFFFLYVTTLVFHSDFWADLLAPACDLLAAGIIFTSIHGSSNRQFKPHFTLIGFSVLSWALADILWAVDSLIFHGNPGGSGIISAFYSGTNLFLLIATILFCYDRFRKWDTFQLILDAVFCSVAILWFLWVLIFDKRYDAFGLLRKDNLVNLAGVTMDLFQILIICIWYLSIRKGTIPAFLKGLAGAVSCYSFADLVYYYLSSKGFYIPDSFLDALYLAALLGLAVGTKLYYVQYPFRYETQEGQNSNIGYLHRGLILIVLPVLVVLLKGVDLFDLGFFAVLIFLHEGFSNYIQTAIGNKRLLNRELAMNHELEQQVAERTLSLKQKNEELRQKNEKLKYITDHDLLTGLYNRRCFLRKLEDAFQRIDPGKKIVLILWNVNHLKAINDTYGHSMGDQVLVLLSERLKKAQSGTGLLARLGGNEFAFAMEGTFSKDEFAKITGKIVHVCGKPIQIGEYLFHVTVSVGASLFPLCALDADTLLKNADVAMHYAKGKGFGSNISLYNEIDSVMKRKHLIAGHLEKADYSREFLLNYQPQFRMADRKLIGMEALLRWNCPGLGPVSPAEFIPIAEEKNLIIPIGNWVIENAVHQISVWNRTYQTDLRMGINISPKQLDQAGTIEIIHSAIQRHKARLKWIDVEITEGVALDKEDKAARIKNFFGNRGISISIDDFGTGYSSLGYLNMMSFDRLKIAKPLIDKITEDESSRKIVASIILLAKSLGLQTISEGVETEQQFSLLLNLGCDQMQGFYLGKPLPSESFPKTFLTNESLNPGNCSQSSSQSKIC